MEGIREEIWKETAFCVFYILDVTEQTQCSTISNTSNNCIKSDRSKFIHKWLHTDPVITHEHHSFSAIFMNNINHLFGKLCYFSALESLDIFKFLRRNTICIIHISLIDNIFRTERITDFFFKLFQNIRADGCGISKPVNIFFPRKFIKNQSKLMEKRSKSYNIYILMGFQKTTETIQ